MSDLSASSQAPQEVAADGERPSGSLWLTLKKAAARLQDWFVIQSLAVKLMVVTVAVLIPVTAMYSYSLRQKQAAVAAQLKTMAPGELPAGGVAVFSPKLPLVFGTGSVLSFLESNAIDRITIIYRPLMWNVSERFVLVESQGKQYAYYPSDMETKIFADKAVTAGWGAKLSFVPRADLDKDSAAMLQRLDQRFDGARPQSEKDG